ncbi:MAG TPA: glycosyltransferase [archaeon]|nr:glycosyltransferase [archaeon]
MKPVLYISYDGLLDPLGYSQIQPYLRKLARAGAALFVLSFEKPEKLEGEELKKVRESLAVCGIGWKYLRYHKRPAVVSTVWDIAAGLLAAAWIVLRRRVGVLHARSYIAATIALGLCALVPLKFLFDMRGLWVDERVEGGLWPAGGVLYRFFKRLERSFLSRADAVVSLTERGAGIVRGMIAQPAPPVAVIPTCADLELFRPPPEKERQGNQLRLVYLGSFGTWYLVGEMLDFFGVLYAQRPGSSFKLVTPSDPALVDRATEKLDLPEAVKSKVTVARLSYRQVPEALAEADCSIFFIRPSFSKQASCATKFAESLACGVPVVLNSGIGDHDLYVEKNRVGVVLEEFNQESYSRAVDRLIALLADSSLNRRCRRVAEEYFSLERAADKYLELYRRMTEKEETAR